MPVFQEVEDTVDWEAAIIYEEVLKELLTLIRKYIICLFHQRT